MLTGKIETIAVIGAGQIGPDIALHFAKSLSSGGAKIIIVDIAETALKKAEEKLLGKIKKGEEAGVFKTKQAETMRSSVTFTSDYNLIKNAQLVVEAATEDENIKDKIFKQVEQLTGNNCVFLSNSSHMQPEVIFRNMKDKSKCAVAHYFFPAEINPVVEIVPAKETSEILVDQLMHFYEVIGKVPVKVKSSYGYAIDPVFEGICQTAIQCLENGWGNEKEIDAAAVKALGLGVGPFTALNLTGGNPITAHGLDEMGHLLHAWFKTPEAIKEKNNKKEKWNTAARGEVITLSPEKEEKLVREFRGAYFALCGMILEKGLIDISDFNMSCEMSLVIKPPFEMMNRLGVKEVIALVNDFCKHQQNFPMPKIFSEFENSGTWKLKDITTSIRNNVLLITIRRPKYLNALNLEVLAQIQSALEIEKNNDKIKAAVITGFGTKAFVSGADINMLASLNSPEEGYRNSQTFQAVLNYIEHFSKPVVCAMNGFAFGGGNELAMACTARISKKDLAVLVCQPEVNLGFIPGAGGTQRLPRIVGVEKAAEILRTARSVSSKEAAEIGLIYKECSADLVSEAIQLALGIAEGKVQVKKICEEPLNKAVSPAVVDLGHLSKKIDEIMVRAIYEGSKLKLPEALDLESRMFAECMKTEDMKIGLSNFKQNGPKKKAEFIHK